MADKIPALNFEINALVTGLQALQNFQSEITTARDRLVALNNSVDTSNLEEMRQDLQNVAQESETVGQAFIQMVNSGLSTATGQTAEGFRQITQAVTDTGDAFATLTVDQDFGLINDSVGALHTGIDGLTTTVGTFVQANQQATQSLGDLSNNNFTFVESQTRANEVIIDANSGLIDLIATANANNSSLNPLVSNTGNLAGSLTSVSTASQEVSESLTNNSEVANSLSGNTFSLVSNINSLGSGFGVLLDNTSNTGTALSNVTNDVADTATALDNLSTGATNASGDVATLNDSVSSLNPPTVTASNAINELLSALDTRTDLEINQDIAEVNRNLEELSNQFQTGAITQAEFDRANTVGAERLQNLQNELNNTATSTGDVQSGFMAFAENAMPQTTESVTGLVGGFQALTQGGAEGATSATILGTSLGKLAGVAGVAVTAIIGLVGAINLKEAVDYSARLESLNQVMVTVGGNAGYSQDQLSQFESEVTSLGISSASAKTAIAQMAGAGLELGDAGGKGASQISQLADAAKNLSIVAGTDASEALENLIININQADTEGLRNMGIILDQVKAEEQYAKALGVSAGALNAGQKQQATFNYVLSEASKFSGIYADSLNTTEAQIAALSQAQSNLQKGIGDTLLPAYKAVIAETRNFTQAMADSVAKSEDLKNLGQMAVNLGTNLSQSVFKVLGGVVDFVIEISDEIFAIGDALGEVVNSVVEVASSIFGAFSGNISAGEQFEVVLKALAVSAYAIADGFKVIELVIKGVLGDIQVMVGTTLSGLSSILTVVNKDVADNVREFAEAMKKTGEENRKSSQQIVDDFGNGNSALNKFVNGAKDAEKALANLGKASNFSELNAQLEALVGKQKEMSSVEVSEKIAILRANIDELKNSGGLTEQELGKLNIKLGTLSKNIETEYADAFTNLGTSINELKTGVSQDTATIAGSLSALATNAKTTANDFALAFNFSTEQTNTVGELNKMMEAVTAYGERSKKAGADGAEGMLAVSNATVTARGKFEELFETQLQSAKSSEDFKLLTTDVQNFGEQMVKAGRLTQEELNLKLAQVADTAKDARLNLIEAGNVKAFQGLGVDIDVVRTGLSSATNDMIDNLDQLLVSGQTTAKGFEEAFSQSFNNVKNIDEWTAIKQKLDEARESGQLFGQELTKATDDAKIKFQELLQSQIDSANTKEKFDELKESIANAGTTGALTGAEMAQAYQQVQEKIDSAKVSVLELAQQQKALSDQQIAISQAETDITRSKVEASKAEISYQQALQEYSKSGSELARVELEARRLELQLAKERVILAERKYEVEKANLDTLIAQQQQLNAEKALEIDVTNEALQSSAKRAKDEAEAKALVATKTQEAYNQQQLVVSATEQASIKARGLADNMKATAQNAEQAKNEAQGLANETQRANNKINDFTGITFKHWGVPNLTKELIAMGVEAERAGAKAEEMVNRANAYQWGGIMHGYDLGNYTRVNGYLEEERKQLEEIKARKENISEIEKRNADIAQQNLDAQKAGYDAILQKGQDQIANAEALAKGGVAINDSYNTVAKDGMSKANEAMQEFKRSAREVANSAIETANSFISGNQSIQEELLKAQGKEEEALKLRYQARKAELQQEYELLKVKLLVAQATAQSAGIDISPIIKAMAEASKSYADTMSALNELEKIDTQKLADKRKAEEARKSEEIKKATDTATKTATEKTATPSTTPTSNTGNKTPVVINIDGKSTKVEASDTEVDNLISVLSQLKGRRA